MQKFSAKSMPREPKNAIPRRQLITDSACERCIDPNYLAGDASARPFQLVENDRITLWIEYD